MTLNSNYGTNDSNLWAVCDFRFSLVEISRDAFIHALTLLLFDLRALTSHCFHNQLLLFRNCQPSSI